MTISIIIINILIQYQVVIAGYVVFHVVLFLMKKYLLWYPQSVEEDFVDMRKDNPESISAEDLHRLLVLAR